MLFRNGAFIFFGLIIGFLFIEIMIAAGIYSPFYRLMPAVEPQLGGPNREIGYAYQPGRNALWTVENKVRIHINDQSLRYDSNIPEKKDGDFRIALMGDSYTEALQVEQPYTFAALAQDLLRQDKKVNADIINFALAGSNFLRMLVRFEQDAPLFKPDMAVFLFPENKFYLGDLRDDSQGPGYKIDADGEVVRSYSYRNRFSQRYADTVIEKAFTALMYYSHIFRSVYYKAKAFKLPSSEQINYLSPKTIEPKALQIADDKCYRTVLTRSWDFWNKGIPEEDSKITNVFLKELHESAKKAGYQFPVILALRIPVPAASCVEQIKLRQRIVSKITKVTGEYRLVFVDWNEKTIMDIGVDDDSGLQSLQGFGRTNGSGHLNYRGHQVWGQVLAEVLSPFVKGDSVVNSPDNRR